MKGGRNNELGELVKRLREAAGLSIRALAVESGVNHANIVRLEAGEKSLPRRESLERLAAALGADPADFLTLAGYATGEALPSFTPYLRTKYGHLPAYKRKELEQFFAQIEAEYGSKAKPVKKVAAKKTTKRGGA